MKATISDIKKFEPIELNLLFETKNELVTFFAILTNLTQNEINKLIEDEELPKFVFTGDDIISVIYKTMKGSIYG